MIRPRYTVNEDSTEVLSMHLGPNGPKTYAVYASDLPAGAGRVTHLMNAAYFEGYRAAQADIRKAIGAK